MTAAFPVLTTPRFDRLLKQEAKHHAELPAVFEQVITILAADPHNRSHRYRIKKLSGREAADGQYRLRFDRWRFRYDIEEHSVVLKLVRLRKDAYK